MSTPGGADGAGAEHAPAVGAPPTTRSSDERAAAAERTTARMADALRVRELRTAAARRQLEALERELLGLEAAVGRLVERVAAVEGAAAADEPAEARRRARVAELRLAERVDPLRPGAPRGPDAIADDLEQAAARLRRLRDAQPDDGGAGPGG